MKTVRIGITIGMAVAATAALAMPSMLGDLKKFAKPPKDSALDKAGCASCHVGHGPKLNVFGEDIKKNLGSDKKITAEVLKKVAKLDSDKDGVKNEDEIKKGTLPGDPKSK